MDRNFRETTVTEGAGASPPSKARLFAQALLGKPIPSAFRGEADTRAKREHLERLASISDRHADELRRLQSAEAEARRRREQLEWLAQISPKHERQFRRLLATEAEARAAQGRFERFVEGPNVQEAQWDPAKHPRRGGPPNAGWWATTGGAGGSAGGGGSTFRTNLIRQRDAALSDVLGGPTPEMIRKRSFAVDFQSTLSLPGEVARAGAAGLGTGLKAVVNSSATAVKNVATLGLSSSQLELIGVTKEDRDRGYDTAVAIATASGEVLIAVGTGGIASALSKGGTVARTASGALLAYDAAGNAVGVVQGTYDAAKDGVNLSNGTQVAAGVLGLGANVAAVKGGQSFTSRKTLATPASSNSFTGEFVRVKPDELRFSQTTAGGSGRAAALRESMRNGWNGPAIDAVRTPEGLVTIDNTRVAVAQELGIPDIPVKVRLPSDPLPDLMLGRFGNARTWGEALRYRTGLQIPPLSSAGSKTSPRTPR